MPRYLSQTLPAGAELDPATAEWLRRELDAISRQFNFFDLLQLEERHREPDKVRPGMVVLADGSDWDPGSGAGVYAYYGGSWNKLG